MRIKLFILSIFISSVCFGQDLKFGDKGTDIQGHSYPIVNGGTSLFTFKTNVSQSFVPIVLPAYATASEPSGNWLMGFDSDSATNAIWYRDGSGTLHRFGSIGGGAGGGGTVTSITGGYALTGGTITTSGTFVVDTTKVIPYTDTLKTPNGIATQTMLALKQNVITLTTTGTSGAATLSGGTLNIPQYTSTNAILQGGNAFGATMVLGTTDNNRIDWWVNNAVKMTMFANGDILVGTSATDPGVTLGVSGAMKLGGTISSTANTGFSMASGNAFSILVANNAASNNGMSLGMNNNWNVANTSKNFINLNSSVQMSSGTGETITGIHDVTVINNTGGAGHVYQAFVFDPVLTSTTGTTLTAFKNTAGNNLFNVGNVGTTTFGGVTTFATPTTTLASLNLPAGTAVTSPGQGDLFATTGHLFYRDQSTTYDLLSFSNFYTTNGTLSGNRTITSGGNNLTLSGTGIFTIGSGFALSGVSTSGDNNYTSSVDAVVIVNTPTANRTITLPTASSNVGRYVVIMDRNTSGTFTWSFTNTVVDSGGNTISTLVNSTVYQLMSDGSQYVKIN